jgi:DNA-binding LacI/PurR family transcriptional regulator
LLDLGIPVLAFDRRVRDPRADSVTADNVSGARRATELLVSAGHRRIGFVAGRVGVQTGDDRLAGYRLAISAAALDPVVAYGEFSFEGGKAATSELLASHPPLTGLLVANNQMTLGSLELAREKGVRVPEEVAVVAFDDPPWASLVQPPLTTLAQPLRSMADAAVDLLFERMSDARSRSVHPVFDFELRIRRSCGTAAH